MGNSLITPKEGTYVEITYQDYVLRLTIDT